MSPQAVPVTKAERAVHAQLTALATWCGRSTAKVGALALGNYWSEVMCARCRSAYVREQHEAADRNCSRLIALERRAKLAFDTYRHRAGLPTCAFERLAAAEQQAWKEVVECIVEDVGDAVLPV